MATIQENRKNGKLVSYKFTACVGRDANGKQIRYYRTWTPPREYAPAKARKCAQLEAAQWEQAILGHTNASTTLNFYVKADLQQMKTAADKLGTAFGL